MSNAIDSVSMAMSPGLPRRHMLRTIGAAIVAAASGVKLSANSATSTAWVGQPQQNEPQWRTITLLMRHGEHTTKLTVPDRFAARVTFGSHPTLAIVPQIVDETQSIELSLYQHSSMALLKRVSLGLRADAANVDWGTIAGASAFASLPAVAFSADAMKRAKLATDYTEDEDCCVKCCWGGSACACEVACDSGNPGCGNCCDTGCCEPVPL